MAGRACVSVLLTEDEVGRRAILVSFLFGCVCSANYRSSLHRGMEDGQVWDTAF